MICAGIDAGSRAIKVALVDEHSLRVLACGVADQGVDQDALASRLFLEVLKKAAANREAVGRIVATGYGRSIVSLADTTITEITCQAAGVRHLVPDAALVIDIGGQDSKVIWLDGGGQVRDFAMNDRCAAGTGRFLEVVATRLGAKPDGLGELGGRSRCAAAISSMCVVFAETEIVGLLASGTKPEDIVAGVQASIATRVASMVGRRASGPVVFTGGVAMVSGMEAALAEAMQTPVRMAPQPQMTAAIGAAVMAANFGSNGIPPTG